MYFQSLSFFFRDSSRVWKIANLGYGTVSREEGISAAQDINFYAIIISSE